jgi:hypothetical protein
MIIPILLLAASVATPQDSFPQWGLGPIAGYSSTTGLVGGAQVSLVWPTTVLAGEVSASTKGAVTFGPELTVRGRTTGLRARVLYEKQLESEYYGPGNAGDPDTSAAYDIEQQEAEAVLTWTPRHDLTLGVGLVGRHSTTFDREDSPLWDHCPTDLTGSQMSAGPRLEAEWQGELLLPAKVSTTFLHQEGGEASYSRLRGQLAAYLPLGGATVLAGRGRLSRHFGTASTPFPHQLFLGSLQGLRGYRDGRFSGDWALLCSAELRREVLRATGPRGMDLALALVAFGDAGQVADGPEGLAMGRFHAAGGLGVRVLLPGNMVMAIDGALSPEGFGLSTGYGHTF